jgi:hypothetical protein
LDYLRIHSYTPLSLHLDEAKLKQMPDSTEVIIARLNFHRSALNASGSWGNSQTLFLPTITTYATPQKSKSNQ